MKNDEIKITVLMPAYNASNYIGEAIESVLKQTFSEFELLIVDDGSTDNTADIIRRFILIPGLFLFSNKTVALPMH